MSLIVSKSLGGKYIIYYIIDMFGKYCGYISTESLIQYWDMDTNLVKTPKHVNSDKWMNDIKDLTPNTKNMEIYLVRHIL